MAIGHSQKLNELGTLPLLELNQCEVKRKKKMKSLGILVDEGGICKISINPYLVNQLMVYQDVLPSSRVCDVYRALFDSH